MPRDASGTYTLPESPFVSDTTISSAAVNSDFSDIATALTGSLSRTGDGGMTAVLELDVTGFVFTVDPDTGIRRSAGNTMVVKAGGTDVVTWTTAGEAITGDLAVSGNAAITGNTTVTGTFGVTGATTLGTLTATTINGAALSGTFTGTPTFSGAVIFSGTPSITNGAALGTGTYSGNATFSGNLTYSGTVAITGQLTANNAAGIIGKNTAKAWGYVTWSAGTPTLQDSFGVTSITDDSTGVLTVTLNYTAANANYAVVPGIQKDGSATISAYVRTRTTTTFTFNIRITASDTLVDPDALSFVVFDS